MNITLLVDTLKNELQTALEDSKKERERVWKRYVEKMIEYHGYLMRHPSFPDKLKSPPHLSLPSVSQIEESLAALNMHTLDTIVLDDMEFKNLKSGIQNLRAGYANTIAYIEEATYTE